jgi:hypothetical protein
LIKSMAWFLRLQRSCVTRVYDFGKRYVSANQIWYLY